MKEIKTDCTWMDYGDTCPIEYGPFCVYNGKAKILGSDGCKGCQKYIGKTQIEEAVMDRLKKQTRKGIKKYGYTLEENNESMLKRLDYIADELVDGLQYIEWLKRYFKQEG